MQKYTQSAFTIVELLITIVVMVILLGLGTVSISGLQAQGRDKERAQDVAAIARGLEEAYKNGNPVVTSTNPSNMITRGAYPGIREFQHAKGEWPVDGPDPPGTPNIYDPLYTPTNVTGGYMTKLLPGTTAESLKPPSSDGYLGIICVYNCGDSKNTTKLQEAFGNPGGTGNYRDAYVYEPIASSNKLCWDRVPYNSYFLPDSPCAKFNLYWISETDKSMPPASYPQIPGLKIVKSKHQ